MDARLFVCIAVASTMLMSTGCSGSPNPGTLPSSSAVDATPVVATTAVGDELAARLWTAASADARMSGLLAEKELTVIHVFEATGQTPGPTLRVLAVFAETLPDDRWPIEQSDVCAIDHEPGMTGVVWAADRDGLGVSVSPRWGGVDCLGSAPDPVQSAAQGR